jgi:serine/threonine-protein kinase
MGQAEPAKIYFDSAASELETIARRGAEQPHEGLALVYAALGRHQAALREADLASSQAPVSREPFLAVGSATNLAETYVLAGAHEKALDNLEWVLSVPSSLSVGILRADPIWDPVRNHPRFQALLAKYQH